MLVSNNLKQWVKAEYLLPLAGIFLGLVLVYIKFKFIGLLIYIPVMLVVLYLQYKIKILSKIVRIITEILSHVVAAVLQIVVIVGRKKEIKSGWVDSKNWSEPSESLWGDRFSTKEYYKSYNIRSKNSTAKNLTSFVLLLVAVLCVDVITGKVINSINPVDPLSTSENLMASGIENENLAKLQKDARKFVFDYSEVYPNDTTGYLLWDITEGASDTINYNKKTGRKTYNNYLPGSTDNADSEVLTVAIFGGSSAFGTGQEDSATIASELATIFKENQVNAIVYNFGVPAYTTFQAAKSIEEKYMQGETFDVILVLSGYNDIILGGNTKKVPETFLDDTMSLYYDFNPLLSWADNSFIARMVGYKPRQKKPIMSRVDRNLKEIGYKPSAWPEGTSEAVEYNIVKGVEELNNLRTQYGLEISYVWVPRKLMSNAKSNEDTLSRTARKLAVVSQKNLAQKEFEGKNFTDLDRIGISPDCFLDEVHTVNSCSREQAEAIIEDLKKNNVLDSQLKLNISSVS